MKLPVPLMFDWNKGNFDKNWLKHKVSSKEAEEIFFNRPLKIFEDKKHSQKEERLLAYGITNRKRHLMIVFTLREEKIRIISARNQNKKERRVYEK
jgi:uncharacterized protein